MIALTQVLLSRDLHLLIKSVFKLINATENYSEEILIGALIVCNLFCVLLSQKTELKGYMRFYLFVLVVMGLFVIGVAFDIILRLRNNGNVSGFAYFPKDFEKVLGFSEDSRYYNIFESVCYLLVITNSSQAIIMLFQEIRKENNSYDIGLLSSSLVISGVISLIFYLVFGLLIYLNYLIKLNQSSDENENDDSEYKFSLSLLLEVVYRFTVAALLVFQASVNILPTRQAVYNTFCSSFQSTWVHDLILTIGILLICGSINIKTIQIEYAYIVVGCSSLIVGIFPGIFLVKSVSTLSTVLLSTFAVILAGSITASLIFRFTY